MLDFVFCKKLSRTKRPSIVEQYDIDCDEIRSTLLVEAQDMPEGSSENATFISLTLYSYPTMKTFALIALAGSATAFAPVAHQVNWTEVFFHS